MEKVGYVDGVKMVFESRAALIDGKDDEHPAGNKT